MKRIRDGHQVFLSRLAVLTAVAVLSAGTALTGDMYTAWTGKGDGHSWNDANNWKGALDNPDPAAWEDGQKPYNAHHNFIQIDTDIDGFTGVLTNNLSNLNYIDNLTIKGSKSITIVSDYQLGFRTGNTKGIDASTSGEVTFDCRIEVYNYPYLMFQGPSKVVFLRDVYLDGRWRMNDDTSPSTAEMHFYGTVSGGENSYLEMVYGGGHVYFHQPVTLARAQKPEWKFKNTKFHFLSSGSQIDTLELAGYGEIHCDCANAFSEEQVMTFAPWYEVENQNCKYVFGSNNQVFDRIESKETKAEDGSFQTACVFGYESDMTLTLLGSADATTYAKAMGNTTIIWDSVSGHVQTFMKAPHSTTGDLVVSNGTVRLDGNTTFLGVPRVIIAAGGRLELGTAQTQSPFAATCDLVLETGAKLVIPAEMTVSFATVMVDGRRLGKADYARGNASWIDGEGKVSVVSDDNVVWKESVSGDWGSETKWLGGLPSSSKDTYITAIGPSDYTVSAAGTLASRRLTIMGPVDHVATLKAVEPMTLAAIPVDMGEGARLEVPQNGEFVYCGAATPLETDGSVFRIHDGALFASEGNVFFTNFTGNVILSGSDSVTSRLSVAKGMLTVASTQSYTSKLRVEKGGLIEVKGDAVFHPIDPQYGGCSVSLFGGCMDFSGTSEYRQGGSWQTIFGSGTVVFRGDSFYTAGQYGGGSTRPYFAPFLSGEENAARLIFSDRAHFDGETGNSITIDGSYNGMVDPITEAPLEDGYSYVEFSSEANSSFGATIVGKDKGHAELAIKAGCLNINNGNASDGLRIGDGDTTGRVSVAGGVLYVRGSTAAGYFYGLKVADGDPAEATRRAFGELAISGGCVTNDWGPLLVGCGCGVGRFVMTGGDYYGLNRIGEDVPSIFGYAGGSGELVVSNGNFWSRRNIYIGGIDPTRLRNEKYKGSTYAGREDTTGGMVVAAANSGELCKVETDGSVIVGERGTGSVEIGSGGQVVAKGSISLSNGANSTLRFVLGAARSDMKGAQANELVVSPGAKLVVDARNYTELKRSVSLFRAKSISGSFAPEDITILAADEPRFQGARVEQAIGSGTVEQTVLKVYFPNNGLGMSVIVR